MKRIVIVAAKRTPFGRFRGGLSEFSPVDLAVLAGDAALADIDRTLIDQVILGNVLAAGHGMNIARQVAIKLGLPVETSALTVNLMCGSGMQSALMAVSAIRAGEASAYSGRRHRINVTITASGSATGERATAGLLGNRRFHAAGRTVG